MKIKDRIKQLEKFISKTGDTDCWNWTGAITSTGYGKIKVQYKTKLAHRHSYELLVGPIDTGLFILHSCDNKLCVNPEHLRQGTQSENIKEMHDKGRFWRSKNWPQ